MQWRTGIKQYMNVLPPFNSVRLEGKDSRAQHIHKVLRAGIGDLIFIGFVNGPRARAKLTAIGPDGSVELKVIGTESGPSLLPIVLMVGLPRPHTARRILFEAASLGVAAMHFFVADHSEPSYAKSRLWQTDEWYDRILRGTEQAFRTYLPMVAMHEDMESAITAQDSSALHLALDNYEADDAISQFLPDVCSSVVVALGPERGWSANERSIFRNNGWKLAYLGPNVLRSETACVATVAAVATRLNLWRTQTQTILS